MLILNSLVTLSGQHQRSNQVSNGKLTHVHHLSLTLKLCPNSTPLYRHTPTSLELTWMDLRRKIRKVKARKPKPHNEQQTLKMTLGYLKWPVQSKGGGEGS